jgi:hypothetical protein
MPKDAEEVVGVSSLQRGPVAWPRTLCVYVDGGRRSSRPWVVLVARRRSSSCDYEVTAAVRPLLAAQKLLRATLMHYWATMVALVGGWSLHKVVLCSAWWILIRGGFSTVAGNS